MSKDCEKLKKEYLEGWQRARADFLNYKKEEEKRFSGLAEFSKRELLLKILPVLDNFEKAEKEIKKKDQVSEGFLQIKKQVQDFLKKEGVEEIKTQAFDPHIHEAVKVVKGKNPGIEEIQKGYTFKGRVLRPAKVKVIN